MSGREGALIQLVAGFNSGESSYFFSRNSNSSNNNNNSNNNSNNSNNRERLMHNIHSNIEYTNNGNTFNDTEPRAYEMMAINFVTSPINGLDMYNSVTFARTGDLCTPKQVMCYNCSEDFEIKSIALRIGGSEILNIPDVKALDNVVEFVENIRIPGDNNLYKTYHLDKTKLFFEVNLMGLPYNEIKIEIKTNGSCEKIKLNNEYCCLGDINRRNRARDGYDLCIKKLITGNVRNYNSGEDIHLRMNGRVNGFILSGINPDIINKISFKTNGHDRLLYNNKYEIRTNTKRINDKSLYINLNYANFDDDLTTSNMNTSVIDSIRFNFGLDPGHENINFNILCYSNGIFTYQQGVGALRFLHSSTIDVHVGQYQQQRLRSNFITPYNNINNNSNLAIPTSWEPKNKKLEGNTECPVVFSSLSELNSQYISCGQCKKNFDIVVKENWVKEKKTCPMCRATWSNFMIYKNVNTNVSKNKNVNTNVNRNRNTSKNMDSNMESNINTSLV